MEIRRETVAMFASLTPRSLSGIHYSRFRLCQEFNQSATVHSLIGVMNRRNNWFSGKCECAWDKMPVNRDLINNH